MPPILLSGNHAKVDQWRRKQSILRTRRRRPDLYERLDLSSKADQKILKELRAEEPELFPEDRPGPRGDLEQYTAPGPGFLWRR